MTPAKPTDEELAEDKSWTPRSLIWWLSLGTAAYVLSIGPMVMLSKKGHISSTAMLRIYAPVVWLHDHTFLRKPLDDYTDWWDRL
jgi:hypothetical protein